MLQDFIGGFLGALGGIALALAALKFLAGKFIEQQLAKGLGEHQHGLAKQLAVLQVQMSRLSDVLSRRNEREFAVTEGAWERVIRAVGTAQGELGDGKRVPVFAMMTGDDALRVIDDLPFDNDQRDALRNAAKNKRDDLYRLFDFRRGVSLSLKEWAELKNWVSTHQIFLHSKVLEHILWIRDELYGLLIHAQNYADDDENLPLKERIDMHRKLAKDFNKAIDDLAETIRTRFGFTEEENAK